MISFMKADIYRIVTKKSRIVLMILALIATLGCSVIDMYDYMAVGASHRATGIYLTVGIASYLFIYTIPLMIFNLFYCFGDDLRAKSMQAAIGMGMGRGKLVVTKWLDLAIISFFDILFYTMVPLLFFTALGKTEGGFALEILAKTQFTAWIEVMMAVTLAMVVIYWSQKAIWGVLVYVFVSNSLLGNVFEYFINIDFIREHSLWNWTSATSVGNLIQQIWLGSINPMNLFMTLLYLAAGFGATILIFKKLELEF